jgi:hypothetical protein
MNSQPSSNLFRMSLVILRTILEGVRTGASSLNSYKTLMIGVSSIDLILKASITSGSFREHVTMILSTCSSKLLRCAITCVQRRTNPWNILILTRTTAEYVRYLRVGPCADEEWFYFELSPLLEDILRSLQHLRSLTRNTHRAVRPAVINLLHGFHPSAKLNLVLEIRYMTT